MTSFIDLLFSFLFSFFFFVSLFYIFLFSSCWTQLGLFLRLSIAGRWMHRQQSRRGFESRLFPDCIRHVDDPSSVGVFSGGGSCGGCSSGTSGPRTGSGCFATRPRSPRGRLGCSSGPSPAVTRTFLSPVTRAAAQSAAAAATTATVALTRGRRVGQCVVASYDSYSLSPPPSSDTVSISSSRPFDLSFSQSSS